MRHVAVTLAAAALVAGAGLSGCAPWFERPFAGLRDVAPGPHRALLPSRFERPVPCGSGPFPSRRPGGPRRDDVVIGAVRFRDLGFPLGAARFAPGSPALTVSMVVPPRSRVIVAVPPDLRAVTGVDGWPAPASTPARAHRAVLCTTSDTTEVFRVSFVVAGARCVPLAVTIDGVTTTHRVGFGVRRCRP